MKKNSIRALGAALFLLFCVPLTVATICAAAGPSERRGGYYHTLVDRIDIAVDSTEFTLQKTTDEVETFEIPFTLIIRKTEPDFYAVLDELELTGLDFSNAVFLCNTPELENARPEGLTLPAKNGESIPLHWDVTLTADFETSGEYTATLRIEYTTGLTRETADSHLTEIPILLHIN